MKRNTLYATLWLGSTAFLLACAQTGTENTDAADGTQTAPGQEQVVDGHHAANALDYFGTYVGVLPCADCEGTNAEIVIAADSTFRYTTFGADGSAEPVVVTGTWTIDRNTITFGEAGLSMHVAENRLIPIGDDGKRFTGELEEQFSLHILQ